MEGLQIVVLDGEGDFHAILFLRRLTGELGDLTNLRNVNERIVGVLNAVHERRNHKVVTVSEGRFRAKTKLTNHLIALAFGGLAVEGVNVVNVLVRKTRTEVTDFEGRGKA